MDLLAGFAGISFTELAIVAAMALFASIVGGVAGYGTGALMPLVLVPIAGAETVVPIIALTAMVNNGTRAIAFRDRIDWPRARLITPIALPGCVLGAYGFTLLSGRGALIVIGATLMLSVPIRRFMQHRGMVLGRRGLMTSAAGYGVLVGGTTGSGILLLSMLLAAGLSGAAVIATDAVISLALGIVKIAVFGSAGVITAKIVAFAVMIGVISLPGAFLAKALVERMSLRAHTALIDAVVLVGGITMIANALLR